MDSKQASSSTKLKHDHPEEWRVLLNTRKKKPFKEILLILILCIPIIALFSLHIYVQFNKQENFDNNTIDDYVRNMRREQLYKQLNESDSLKLVCYYYHPTYNETVELYPENIDAHLCTHLIVGFAAVVNNTVYIEETFQKSMPSVMNLKTSNEDLLLLFSIGGADNEDGFSNMIINHSSRKVFIRSVMEVLHKYGFDGVDIDWEFPSTVFERRHFSKLLEEIRREFSLQNRCYLLTVAVAAPEPTIMAAYDIRELNNYVDFVNLMSYDYHLFNSITPFVGFNSPLYAKKNEKYYLSTLNINHSAEFWVEHGMERRKIIVGLPMYGHSFTLVNSDNNKPGSPAKDFGHLGISGFVHYEQVCVFLKNSTNLNITFDDETFSPYLSQDLEWVSYENVISLKFKTRYIKKYGYGGVMLFSLNSDDFRGVCSDKFLLTQKVKEVLFQNDYNLT